MVEHESRTSNDTPHTPTDRGAPGAVVIADADRGAGLSLARAIAGAGVPVALHSAEASSRVAEALHEIVVDGGRAVAVEKQLAGGIDPTGVLEAAKDLVGEVSTVVLSLPTDLDEEPIDKDSTVDLRALRPARQALRWGRSVADGLDDPGDAVVIGVVPANVPGDVVHSVARGAWEGALETLADELGRRGARVHTVHLGDSGDADAEASTIREVVDLMTGRSGDDR